MTPASGEAGFTLLEVLVALILFALIALAGVALIDTVLDVQARTDGRLDRLADVERAMVVVTRDLTEIADAPLVGSARGIGFDRHGPGGVAGVSYRLTGETFERIAGGRTQILVDHVGGLRWRYYAAPRGWQDRWPATDAQGRGWPAAVALDVTFVGAGIAGPLRRVVVLPVRPLAPGQVAP